MRRMLLAAVGAALLLGSCDAGKQGSARDILDVGIWQRPLSFDPHRASRLSEKMIAAVLYPGLVEVDGTGQVMPALAESWDISPDGLTYIFRLKNKKWSDGDALNAEDVVLTFQRLFDRKSVPLAAAQLFEAIQNATIILERQADTRSLAVRALADDIVEIRLSHPEPSLLQRLALPQAAVVPMHSQRRLGKDMFKPGKMVTSSAFKADIGDGLQISLKRQVKSGQDQSSGQYKAIYFHMMKDDASALAAFAAHKIDLLDASVIATGLLEGQDRAVRDQLHAEPSWSTVYMAANIKSGPMADRRVRLALAMATDQQRLVEAAFPEQRVQPLQSLLPPLLPSYGAPVQSEWISWSAAQRSIEVNRLLTEAGYGLQKPLRLRLLITGADADQRIAQALRDQWSGFGIALDVTRGKDQADVLRQAKLGGQDLVRISFDLSFDSPEAFLQNFGCKSRTRLGMMICNSEADGLLTEAAALNDSVQRSGRIKRAEQLLLADLPALPLYVPARRYLVSKSVAGWIDSPASVHPLASLAPAP
jgi:oligopeptide transport system substrate-binding protein